MTEMQERALERLTRESGTSESGQKEKVVSGPVAEALKDFCRQSDEFARAVVQGGGFQGCLAAVVKNCGGVLSDLEAYRRAVSYYFPGAQVDMKLSIRMSQYEAEDEQETEDKRETAGRRGGLLLDLTDFL